MNWLVAIAIVGAMVLSYETGRLAALVEMGPTMISDSRNLLECQHDLGEADIEVGGCYHALVDCEDSNERYAELLERGAI